MVNTQAQVGAYTTITRLKKENARLRLENERFLKLATAMAEVSSLTEEFILDSLIAQAKLMIALKKGKQIIK